MRTAKHVWQNDLGFVWMFFITVLTLVSTQLPTGVFGERNFILRFCFFLFTLLAVQSSALPKRGKTIGYLIASSLFLLSVAIIFEKGTGLLLFYTVGVTLYMVFIIALVINQIFASGRITARKIAGGVAVYLLLGHLWTSLYLTLYMLAPDSFQFGGESIAEEEAIEKLSYFSIVSLTTIGYGDLLAVSPMARILAMTEGLLGQLFPTIFIAKLVALQIEHSRST